MMRQTGIPRAFYEEQRKLSETSFRYRSKSDPIDVVEALSDDMHVYPSKSIAFLKVLS